MGTTDRRWQLHDPSETALWDLTNPGVSLVALTLATASDGTRTLTVEGVCRGVTDFDVDVTVGGTTVQQAVRDASTVFSVAVVLPGAGDACSVAARDANGEMDRATVWLTGGRLSLPVGQTAGLVPARARFLGGISDRLIERVMFSRLMRTTILVGMPTPTFSSDQLYVPSQWTALPAVGAIAVDLVAATNAVVAAIKQHQRAFRDDGIAH